MKIIVSHDIDHGRPSDHRRDLIVPKFLVRFGTGWLLGRTPWREVRQALQSLKTDAWDHVDELTDFDAANEVPSTFFVAVRQGRKLAYSTAQAEGWIARIRAKGFDVGLHGMDFRSPDDARREFELFTELVGVKPVGVRVHDIGLTGSSVHLSHSDLGNLKAAGHVFGSTTFDEIGPWSLGGFWEFPVHLMDCDLFSAGQPWRKKTVGQARLETIRRLTVAAERGVNFFSLLFHDTYFADYYRDYRDWYVWVIGYLRDSGYKLCSYRQAIKELNGDGATDLTKPE